MSTQRLAPMAQIVGIFIVLFLFVYPGISGAEVDASATSTAFSLAQLPTLFDKDSVSLATRQRIDVLLQDEIKAAGTDQLSREQIREVATKYLLSTKTPPEQVANLLGQELARTVKEMSLSGKKKDSALTGYVSLLLVPYLYDEGMCTGDLWSNKGLTCGYLNPSKNGQAIGHVGSSSDSAPALNLTSPKAGSPLSGILNQALDQCQAITASTAALPAGGTCFDVRLMDGRLTVVRLNDIEYAAYKAFYAKKVADYSACINSCVSGCGACANLLPSFRDFLISYITDRITVEVYGEYYAAANIQYLVNDSDSAFLVFPYGVSCKIGDCDSIKSCADGGGDALACADAYGTRGFWNIRPNGGQLQHSIASCTVVPLPYASRVPYNAIQEGLISLPDGVTFQTKHQQQQQIAGTSSPLPLSTGLHLYPQPDSYYGPIIPSFELGIVPQLAGDTTWTYNFSEVDTWDYNFIFAGLQANNVANAVSAVSSSCSHARNYGFFNNLTAYGDVFWRWRGNQNGTTDDCSIYPLDSRCPGYIGVGAGGEYPTPFVDIVFSHYLNHLPVTACLPQPPPPPCHGLDCLPPPTTVDVPSETTPNVTIPGQTVVTTPPVDTPSEVIDPSGICNAKLFVPNITISNPCLTPVNVGSAHVPSESVTTPNVTIPSVTTPEERIGVP